jgi:ring-1,2-phenylacetyl-CoA epoxidase subunit PaaD
MKQDRSDVSLDTIWQILDTITDPEIPVVSLVEMGIVRDVVLNEDGVTVTITPTFAGCPALAVMREDIIKRLGERGLGPVHVQTVLHPPWTSDWISDTARDKLEGFGLALPARHRGDITLMLDETVACPRCGSKRTSLKNTFGSTLCRMIYTCNDCREPFERFKAI